MGHCEGKRNSPYDRIAYDYQRDRDKFDNTRYLTVLDELLPPGSNILDIGCGSGHPVDTFLVSRGHHVHGIDVSEGMLTLARSNVPEATYAIRSMLDMSFGQYNVNGIVSLYSIFHTPRVQHQAILDKMNSFLPIGGLILITMGAFDLEGQTDEYHGVELFWSQYDPRINMIMVTNSCFEPIINEISYDSDERHQVILARKVGELTDIIS